MNAQNEQRTNTGVRVGVRFGGQPLAFEGELTDELTERTVFSYRGCSFVRCDLPGSRHRNTRGAYTLRRPFRDRRQS